MTRCWTILFLLITASSLKAQRTGMPGKGMPAGYAFRFNILGLADIMDGNLSLGMERRLGSRLSVTTDLSMVFYSVYLPQIRSTMGYIIKPAIRYYTTTKRRTFVEAAFFYKRVGYKKADWLGKDCVNDVPAYEEFQRFVFRKQVTGVNIQAGIQRDLTKNKLLGIEMYAGIGIRFKWQDIRNDPMACYQVLNQPNRMPYIAPGIPHGLRFIYRIL
ncbi:MAG: hypothetical protein WKF89_15575 [Chitinophagaceae bacterium]